jgi:hypothetical protein
MGCGLMAGHRLLVPFGMGSTPVTPESMEGGRKEREEKRKERRVERQQDDCVSEANHDQHSDD